jgi:hypothetical protein
MNFGAQMMDAPRPESSFPTAWGEELDALPMHGNMCPISEEKMAEYMAQSQNHHCLDEEPVTFTSFRLLSGFSFPDRYFWIWSCTDGLGREWNVLVGHGRSPFVGESCKRTWMHGERHSVPQSRRDILIAEYPEYENMAGKAN